MSRRKGGCRPQREHSPAFEEKSFARCRCSLQGLLCWCGSVRGLTSYVHGPPHLRWRRACRLRGARSRVTMCNACIHECNACVLTCPHVHTQPRRSVVFFWCLAKRNGWQGNNSFVFPGKPKTLLSGMLAMGNALLEAPQTMSTSRCFQPRRSVACFWCSDRGKGGRTTALLARGNSKPYTAAG